MPIPDLDARGLLPPGLYACSLEELRARFGVFAGTDRRVRLFERLAAYVVEARSTGLVRALVVDGSFITAKPEPGDVDLVVVLLEGIEGLELKPFAYNALSRKRVAKRYAFDAVVAPDGSTAYREYLAFFAQVKDQPEVTKGLLRVEL